MTDFDLSEAKRLGEAATPGEWKSYCLDVTSRDGIKEYLDKCVDAGTRDEFYFVSCEKDDGPADVCHTGNGPDSPNNAFLIAYLRTHWQEIILRLDALEDVREGLFQCFMHPDRAKEIAENYLLMVRATLEGSPDDD